MSLIRLSVFCLGLASAAGAELRGRGEISRLKALPELRTYDVQRVQLPTTAGEALAVGVTVEGENQTLELQPVSLRTRSFQVLVQGEDGLLREQAAPGPVTYRGTVAGVPESRVVASLAGGQLSARVEMGPGDVWHVEPMARFSGVVADASDHVLYRDEDLIPGRFGCGARSDGIARTAFENFAVASAGSTAASNMKICDIAFDADHEFYVLNGNSLTQTVRDIEDILNRVALVYEDQLNVTFALTTIIVRTAEPDPYSSTNHDSLLAQMRTEWNTNRTNIHRDIAHLMTGKDIDGSVIGSTHTGALCQTCNSAFGYGFSQSRFSASMALRTCLTAHELGHSFGAQHCDGDSDCYIMCSVLGQCAQNCTQFGSRAQAAIAVEIASVSCLSTLAPPQNLPFCDTFDLAVDSSKWAFNAVATISTSSLNPPSPPGALFLDNCCTPCVSQSFNAPDEVRSNFIRLGGSSAATLTYYTEHNGGLGTAGSQLFVEYWSIDQEWVELNALTANGTAQTSFTFWSHDLPVPALHDEFRLRFRLSRASGQASWFVDNVSISDEDLSQPVLYVRADAPLGGNGSSWAEAFQDLQDALSAAACSRGVVEEIWVAAGTYRPDRDSGDRTASFRLLTGTSLLGGFQGTEFSREQRDPAAYRTTLSGDIGVPGNVTDNSFHVITAGNAGEGTVLDGFTISGGQANGTSPNDSGGGLWNNGSSVVIRNCTFSANSARNGGAVKNLDGATPRITDCLFQNNSATSAGGAIHSSDGSAMELVRSRFLKNSATAAGGALFTSGSDLFLSDSIFSGNSAATGGGLQNFGSAATLINCTLSRNTAVGSGGGIVNLDSGNTMQSCILWGNSDLNGMGESSQVALNPPSVNYSCIQGWTGTFGGMGNTGTDPQLVDADGSDNIVGTPDDNLRLASGSPAINRGEPDFLPAPDATDLDGRPRVLCDRVDKGAYEFGIGDYDCNGTVDLDDFDSWPVCLTGPGGGPLPADCTRFDFNTDHDVDLEDHAGFQRSFAGNLP